MNSSPGKMFVSYDRGVMENSSVKHFTTLNFGTFKNEFKQPLGHLFLVNDDILYASKQIIYSPPLPSFLITLPITGKIYAGLNSETPTELDVEQVRIDVLTAADTLKFENRYTADWVNYLQFGVKMPDFISPHKAGIFDFDITTKPNQLVSLFGHDRKLPFSMHMCIYDGCRESIFTLRNEHALLFAFVVSGDFEFQGRLLHERDSLALWDTREIELEALSERAVIVLLEMDILA